MFKFNDDVAPDDGVVGMTAKEVQRWLLEERGEYHPLEEVERRLEAARQEVLTEDSEDAEEQRMLDQAYELQAKIDAYRKAAE